jgi:hypothetical protein
MRRSICLILACIFILFLSGILSKAESKTLTGTLYYRDAPMSTLTEASPQFWFYDYNTYKYLYPDRDLTINYDPTNSTYEILDCPESTNFLIDVSFPGEYGSDTDLPKSYNRQIRIDTTTLDSQDIQLYYNIHLLTPYDNSNVNMYYPPSPYPTHNSPVQFSWEAVTGANSYEIKIQRTRDEDNPEGGYGDIETIINENTTSLTYTADIPSSASFEHYEFSLSAYENGTYLGHYTTLYIGAHGSDYRFKISKKKSEFMPWLLLLLDNENNGIDLTGTWSLYHTEGGGDEQGPYLWSIQQNENGTDLTICTDEGLRNGTISGKNISIDLGDFLITGTIVNDYLMQGTFEGGTWRMVWESDTITCSLWDIEANGIPQFVSSDHIELAKIDMISKFRSGVGHDYSDDFESCRSMKHYYMPFSNLDWSAVNIFSPVNGAVVSLSTESFPNSGKQVHIRSTDYPAFNFKIFHVNVTEGLSVGDSVTAGQIIGTHISDITYDDIAVSVSTPSGHKLISFFSVMNNSLFQTYISRGAQSREDFIISKVVRDSDSLNCTGETFGTSGTIENWTSLQ